MLDLGKCKKRTLAQIRRNNFDLQFTRDQALRVVIKEINKNPTSLYAKNLISLFGLSAEELSESGLTYEVLRSLDTVLA